MAIPMHVFREYDIRGLVANELTPEFAEQVGRGFGRYVLEKDPAAQSIVLGRDHRVCSPGLASAFARGARSYAVRVICVGVSQTAVSFFRAHLVPGGGVR